MKDFDFSTAYAGFQMEKSMRMGHSVSWGNDTCLDEQDAFTI